MRSIHVVFVLILSGLAHAAFGAYSLKTVYNFTDTAISDGTGGGPHGGVGVDANGILYGTTLRGGIYVTDPNLGISIQTGIAYSFNPATTSYHVLGSFDTIPLHVPDPWSNMVPDSNGNMYGTTRGGGANGRGSIVMFSASTNTLSTVASIAFSDSNSHGGLVTDNAGHLFGASNLGIYRCDIASKTLTTLASFPTAAGSDSYGNLYRDASGNLYGTNSTGGASNVGTIFKMDGVSHAISTLITFNTTNGATPRGGLIADPDGNLYGTTKDGGANGLGTVFKINPSTSSLTTLASFGGGTTGSRPAGTLVLDGNGNLFGTTSSTVFEIDASTHALTTLCTLTSSIGLSVSGNLVMDSQGNIFGTAFSGGGAGGGSIFEASPPAPEPHGILFIALLAEFMRRPGNRRS